VVSDNLGRCQTEAGRKAFQLSFIQGIFLPHQDALLRVMTRHTVRLLTPFFPTLSILSTTHRKTSHAYSIKPKPNMKINSKLKLVITAAFAGILVSCASVGNNFDETKVSQIKKGETTEADLIQMFGQPQNRTVNSEGVSTLTWTYAESRVNGKTFIPYAGSFLGGSSSKNKTLTVSLLDGKVTSFTSTGGGMEMRENQVQDVPKK
jgi:outer membrane protein assembly factor BamE (lipoprotein component of BamABCDE complex)